MTAHGDPLQEALKSLPHGPEFRFVDRLLSLDPGKEGVGEYLVRGDESWLRGHLPGEPLLPGVLLIEAAAQLAGVVAQNDPLIPPLPGLKLDGASQCQDPRPGPARGDRAPTRPHNRPLGSAGSSCGIGVRFVHQCAGRRTHPERHDEH